MLMRFFNPCDLISCDGDPQPIRFKVRRGVRGGACRGACGGVRDRRVEGLSAKRSLHGGVRGGGAWRGVQRV